MTCLILFGVLVKCGAGREHNNMLIRDEFVGDTRVWDFGPFLGKSERGGKRSSLDVWAEDTRIAL